MKVIAFNGSPREKWNTATLLNKALEGAASRGAETELIHLYQLNYKGCRSCFACKLRDGESYGKCAARDDLTPVLEKIPEADVLIFGSPVYFGTASAEMRAFMERLLFPYFSYETDQQSLFPKAIRTAFIYTMGAPEEQMLRLNYEYNISVTNSYLKHIFGHAETLLVNDTYQFDDYDKYVAPLFSQEEKSLRWFEVFPLDCARAYELGAGLVPETESAGLMPETESLD